jgi:hydrogenase maturation factor
MSNVQPPAATCATDHSERSTDHSERSEHCITCGDDGVPMTVLRVNTRAGLALCADADGARSTVEIALIESVVPGGVLLVHAGTAIASLPAHEHLPPPLRGASGSTMKALV